MYDVLSVNLILTSFDLICPYHLLYILKLILISKATSSETPNMGRKQAKSGQFSQSVAGYKWTQKSAIFGQVTEKGLT